MRVLPRVAPDAGPPVVDAGPPADVVAPRDVVAPPEDVPAAREDVPVAEDVPAVERDAGAPPADVPPDDYVEDAGLPSPEPVEGGCGCRAGAPRASSNGGAAGIALAGILSRRRRRRAR